MPLAEMTRISAAWLMVFTAIALQAAKTAATRTRIGGPRYFFSIEMPPGPRLIFTPSGFLRSW